MALAEVSNHPPIAIPTYGASEDGSRKMPDPIIFPITSAVQAAIPSVFLDGIGVEANP